jgi:hypothetical protein
VHCQNLIMNATEVVLAWQLPDVALADAVRAQVGFMTGDGTD